MRCCADERPDSVSFFMTIDRQWDVRKLEEFFIPDDSMVIQQIPLAGETSDDQRFWYYKASGDYLVKADIDLPQNLNLVILKDRP